MSQYGRIYFKGNPWPEGHAVTRFNWVASLENDGIRFHMHLETEDYMGGKEYTNADEKRDANAASAWDNKGIWLNYHRCTLSSIKWQSMGFLAGTEQKKLNLSAPEHFTVDDPAPEDDDDMAFNIYLMGHDSVAMHGIDLRPASAGRFTLHWKGKVALSYAGDDDFKHVFETTLNDVQMEGIRVKADVNESDAHEQLAHFVIGPEAYEWKSDVKGNYFALK